MVDQTQFNEAITQSPIVLFLGAGASVPFHLPTTAQFRNPLRNRGLEIEGKSSSGPERQERVDRLYEAAADRYGIDVSKIDIEHILDYLQDVGSEARHLTQHIRKVFEIDAPQLGNLRKVSREYGDQIEELVLKTYNQPSGNVEALYKPFIEAIYERTSCEVLPVFTTNYDQVIESLQANETGKDVRVMDGFNTSSYWSRGDFDKWQPNEGNTSIPLFKLHGSIFWYWSGQRIQKLEQTNREAGTFPACILYPSRRIKINDEEPYKTAYGYLEACLQHCKLCIAIGFSFRDQIVNKLFSTALGKRGAEMTLFVWDMGFNEEVFRESMNIESGAWDERHGTSIVSEGKEFGRAYISNLRSEKLFEILESLPV